MKGDKLKYISLEEEEHWESKENAHLIAQFWNSFYMEEWAVSTLDNL